MRANDSLGQPQLRTFLAAPCMRTIALHWIQLTVSGIKLRAMLLRLLVLSGVLISTALAQDVASASLRLSALDPSGAKIQVGTAELRSATTGYRQQRRLDLATTFNNVPAGAYQLVVEADGFARHVQSLDLAVGAPAELTVRLSVAGRSDEVTINAGGDALEVTAPGISTVISEKEISDLPLNGRRFSELALLSPQGVQDPRSLTSTSSGDLAFGGIRGMNTSYIVDGADNNNGFFSQSRGRLRAPYQFSNETIQEFRVSTNAFSVDQGRSAGAVVNVVTKSGTNTHHGSLFYYLRDGKFAATHPFVRKKYPDKQHQFGFSLGGPVKAEKLFYFAGFDQHIFHVPTIVQFEGGKQAVVPTTADYEATDEALVRAAASDLGALGGQFRSSLNGSSGFGKVDWHLTSRHRLTSRLSISRYAGANNVFVDPTSPLTNFAISGNGEEMVNTLTLTNTLNSVFGDHWTYNARLQFSRDDQSSRANSDQVATSIDGIIAGFGRSGILPRRTNEDRWQVANSVGYAGSRHSLRFGGDVLITHTTNFFPRDFGGRYIFGAIRVNPFTFRPQLAGLPLTPLRAYAHGVPRFYIQDFGRAESRPHSNDLALFAQDTIRVTERLALTLGLRYDVQTFREPQLPSPPLWPDAAKVPSDRNNFAPRIGVAATFGDRVEPFIVRGGFGIFYPRIPQIYNSTVELENGTRSRLFLDHADATQRPLFPAFPQPLVSCPPTEMQCSAPAPVASFLTTEISAFAKDFRWPYVQQASLSVEKRVAPRTDVTASYLWVGGRHLIRARDVNLPQPAFRTYPVYDSEGQQFTGDMYSVASFGTWQNVASLTCPFPPCINPVARPDPRLGAVNVFESVARNTYHGFTLSVNRRFAQQFSARLGYTWAKAIDDTQDALVAGRPSVVENSFATDRERALSVTDQRHRFVTSFITEPQPFDRRHALLGKVFNDWRVSGIFSAGSGRPLSGRITGDANRDGNIVNDRLPGASRNSFIGPDYFSGEARLTRRFHLTEQLRVEATAEAFNVFNRNNRRVESTDDGFASDAATFSVVDKQIGATRFPAHFRRKNAFLAPTNAYAPRQVQFSLRLKW